MYNPTLDEQQIIADIEAGGLPGSRAANRLFDLYSYYVQMGMADHSMTEEESLDAYSDAVLSMRDAILNNTYRREAAPGTFIYRAFKNKCIDRFREKTSKKNSVNKSGPLSDIGHEMSDQAKTALEALLLKYDLEKLRGKLDMLDDGCRKLLLLTQEGYSTAEIQAALGFKNGNVVKSSRLRCIIKLRQLYKGDTESGYE